MVDTNFYDKISLIYNFLKDNSIVALVLLLIGIIIMDLMYGKNKKNTKVLYISVISLCLIYIGLEYYKPLINIIDVYIANIFKISYFPSIIEYFSMILITIIVQVISFKKGNRVVKNMNLWIGILIEVLFIVNIMAMNNINVDLTSITSIYENDLLLSIFQITSIVFMIWIIVNLLILLVTSFLRKRVEMPKLLNKEDYE